MLNKPVPPDKNTIRAAGFVIAFRAAPVLSFPDPALPYLDAWDIHASDGIAALVEFRSACRRWKATGQVPPDELAAEYERLHEAGLGGLLDKILGI